MGYLKEASEVIRTFNEEAANRESTKRKEIEEHFENLRTEIEDLKEAKNISLNRTKKYKNHVLTEMLSTAIKAVYITALESCHDLKEQDYVMCESLVDRFIEESGGARELLDKMNGKTYLLNTIKEAVEEAEKEVEEDEDKEDNEVYDKIPEEPKQKMFDKLENEEDVDTAVELIAARISNAEKDFIEKNAEDKEKIESIINDINDRIAAVKSDVNTSEEEKEEIEEEQSLICKRRINAVYENRLHTVFETMVHEMSEAIVKDDELKKSYTMENGSLDMDKIVSSTKCLYGFLEFVNTVQLEKVDEKYIKKVLSEL